MIVMVFTPFTPEAGKVNSLAVTPSGSKGVGSMGE